MSTEHAAITTPPISVARETTISAIASAIISLVFYFAVFRGVSPIALGSGSAFPPDFLIQAFAVGVFAALVPLLVATARLKKSSGTSMSIGAILLRTSILAVLSLALFGFAAFAISATLAGALPWWIGAAVKMAFGALISCAVTPLALRPLAR